MKQFSSRITFHQDGATELLLERRVAQAKNTNRFERFKICVMASLVEGHNFVEAYSSQWELTPLAAYDSIPASVTMWLPHGAREKLVALGFK